VDSRVSSSRFDGAQRAGGVSLLRVASLFGIAGFVASACVGVSAQPKGGSAASTLVNCPGEVGPAADGIIDDFEDGNTRITQVGERDGYWWKSADEESSVGPDDFKPVPGGVGSSKLALHALGQVSSAGEAFALFGANIGSGGKTYDASKYAGVSFRAKVSPGSGTSVRFQVGDVNTHPDLKVCTNCWNHFGRDMALTTEWKEYTVLFTTMRQAEGWGAPRPPSITPDQIYSVGFSFSPGSKFDIWVDDLQFVECK
jgi:hypothetical protein